MVTFSSKKSSTRFSGPEEKRFLYVWDCWDCWDCYRRYYYYLYGFVVGLLWDCWDCYYYS
ncbi:MAG: hypothetical protein Q8O68_00490 [Candidatus Daviesbacteria bacterium]|nr:hypothetical protein [Candidatus Daviesbacteria bacterium]